MNKNINIAIEGFPPTKVDPANVDERIDGILAIYDIIKNFIGGIGRIGIK